ncbi:hypothetical cytosolic protein [Syntrophus aciditrophicus SB]|uniref:Hypothetical cytosolic protein n=1 Tax=Syntrophus aciditrophicus (strain SB) TaxID=56780 RepID=Q2LYH7_SYNAS|nr:hypothetical cytosolic protein [Syntrophus aciditrophicus SB]
MQGEDFILIPLKSPDSTIRGFCILLFHVDISDAVSDDLTKISSNLNTFSIS